MKVDDMMEDINDADARRSNDEFRVREDLLCSMPGISGDTSPIAESYT